MDDCDNDPLLALLLNPDATQPQKPVQNDAMDPTLRAAIGVIISLASSILYAIGLNLIQRDSMKNAKLPKTEQKEDYQRPMWLLGMGLFLASQIAGQTFVITFLDPLYVAPLGAVTLIFNYIIAHFVVKTRITRKDILGTALVVASVVWVVAWGGEKAAKAPSSQSDVTLCYLSHLYSRTVFIVYFLIVDGFTLVMLFIALHAKRIMDDEKRIRKSRIWKKIRQARMQKTIGVIFAVVGGLLASQTLLLGNSGTSILKQAFAGTNLFNKGSALPSLIVAGLAVTAILQVVCLNNALKYVESVIVVPVFYALYTAVGLVNTMIYLDEFKYYQWYVMLCIIFGMAVLVIGVRLLSAEKLPPGEEIGTESRSTDGADADADGDAAARAEDEEDAVTVIISPGESTDCLAKKNRTSDVSAASTQDEGKSKVYEPDARVQQSDRSPLKESDNDVCSMTEVDLISKEG